MSCYFRHIAGILAEAGIKVTADNKKEVDRLVHEFLGVEYKHCPDTWKEFKTRVRDDEAERRRFIAHMKRKTGP
jgi:hypothetical protein